MEKVSLVSLLEAYNENYGKSRGYKFFDDHIDVARLARAVLRGIRACDKYDGATWRESIVLADLQMGSTESCIIGQAYGWGMIGDVMENEGVNADDGEEYNDWIRSHGFDVYSESEGPLAVQWSYTDLGCAWSIAVENINRLDGVESLNEDF